jgi:ribosomal protein S18 acetylase RimI-like enzyme
MKIRKATFEDLPQILDLQKSAFLSEAEALNDYAIQPLTQTLGELEDEFKKKLILKLTDEQSNQIIGSVRAYEKNERVYIGKLIVHPNYQNGGIGTRLLKAIETFYENNTFELYTNGKSEKHVRFYVRNGYKEFKREKVSQNLEFVFMEK